MKCAKKTIEILIIINNQSIAALINNLLIFEKYNFKLVNETIRVKWRSLEQENDRLQNVAHSDLSILKLNWISGFTKK